MKKITQQNYHSILMLVLFVGGIFFIHAVFAAAPETVDLPSPIAAKDVPQLVNSMIKGILGIVGALSLLMFVCLSFCASVSKR